MVDMNTEALEVVSSDSSLSPSDEEDLFGESRSQVSDEQMDGQLDEGPDDPGISVEQTATGTHDEDDAAFDSPVPESAAQTATATPSAISNPPESQLESNNTQVEHTTARTQSTAASNPSGHRYGIHIHTAPIADPDIDDALKQLKAGTHVPEEQATLESNGEIDTSTETPKQRRAVFTREHKLAAIHFANYTFKLDPDGVTNRRISIPEAAETLHVKVATLTHWMRDVPRIAAMEPGTQKQRIKGKKHFTTPPTNRNEKMRRVILYHDPRNMNPEGALSSILAAHPGPRSSAHANTASSHMAVSGAQRASFTSQTYGAPVSSGPAGGSQQAASNRLPGDNSVPTLAQPSGLVSYDTPWTVSAPRRPNQTIASAVDPASTVTNSDLQHSNVVATKVENSTLISTKTLASCIFNGAVVRQSNVSCSDIGDGSEVETTTIENSVILAAKVVRCTIVNCRLYGGHFVGKKLINTIMPNNDTGGIVNGAPGHTHASGNSTRRQTTVTGTRSAG